MKLTLEESYATLEVNRGIQSPSTVLAVLYQPLTLLSRIARARTSRRLFFYHFAHHVLSHCQTPATPN